MPQVGSVRARGGPAHERERWGETERLLQLAIEVRWTCERSQFRKVMKESGLSDHPAVIRVFGGSVKKVLAANRGKAPGLSAIEMV